MWCFWLCHWQILLLVGHVYPATCPFYHNMYTAASLWHSPLHFASSTVMFPGYWFHLFQTQPLSPLLSAPPFSVSEWPILTVPYTAQWFWCHHSSTPCTNDFMAYLSSGILLSKLDAIHSWRPNSICSTLWTCLTQFKLVHIKIAAIRYVPIKMEIHIGYSHIYTGEQKRFWYS